MRLQKLMWNHPSIWDTLILPKDCRDIYIALSLYIYIYLSQVKQVRITVLFTLCILLYEFDDDFKYSHAWSDLHCLVVSLGL